jgi:transcriptional regulator with XRE-family HTH domain
MELGQKIKYLRSYQRMTLEELSNRSGVSLSLLSMIERNRSAPTVRTLERIVKALGTTISQIYREMESEITGQSAGKRVTVFKKSDRKRLVLGAERAEAHYELLTPEYHRQLQFMYIHFPVPREEKTSQFITHEGEECGLILEGRLKAVIGEEEIILEEGDCIYFDSSIPHLMENIGDIEVRAFWVNTPSTF